MTGWLLDTHVIAEIAGTRPERRVERWIASQPEQTHYLSILTIAEYDKGIRNLHPEDPRCPRLRQALLALESRFSGRILSVSDEVVLRWGTISGDVKRSTGHTPRVIDTMLAATAIENGLYLATRNALDVDHSGAAVFNPWKDDAARFPL